jgi:rod shape-determining protein MreC
MDLLLNRYRNLMVLLVAILAQLAMLAYQVKSNGEVRLIRVWAVSLVTPVARMLEGGRGGVSTFFQDYVVLLGVREENRRLKADLDQTKLENQYLRNELSTADRAKALAIFQQQSQSRTVAAHVIGNTTDGGKVVIIDRGGNSGILKGMAVITPEGIAGKVTAVYPTASYVLLITDQTFAAGVISQKNRVHGTVRGQGYSGVMVDHVQNEETVEPGEWFYTSGDDRIFPKGLPVGRVTNVRQGRAGNKEITLAASGVQNGLEEVLIVVDGVHGTIPDTPPGEQPVHLLDPPTSDGVPQASPVQSGPLSTEADRLLERYRRIGEAQNHTYGGPGAPNFNIGIEQNQSGDAPRASDPGMGRATKAPAPKPAPADAKKR